MRPEEPDSGRSPGKAKALRLTDVSSAPSKVSNFAWSYHKTETRATSWSTQARPATGAHRKGHKPTLHMPYQNQMRTTLSTKYKYFEGTRP